VDPVPDPLLLTKSGRAGSSGLDSFLPLHSHSRGDVTFGNVLHFLFRVLRSQAVAVLWGCSED
jgi:hypothetical protein